MVINMVGQTSDFQIPKSMQVVQTIPTPPSTQAPQDVQTTPASPITPVSQPVQVGQSQPGAQNVQVPNYSGVNIQIFNPSVTAPGANPPVSTVNAPTYTPAQSYPANYYTQNLAQPAPVQPVKPQEEPKEPEKKKTEEKEIVQLTDDYIKNLEMYLNNEDKKVRLMGAKEVLARLQEDPERSNDPALNALVNKMLQDPYQPVKFIAMAALDSGDAKGDSTSVQLLQNIQKGNHEQNDLLQNEDSLKASNILLKMSGEKVKKEFEAEDKPEKKDEKA
ncbi:MAG: hypothetical protein PHC64_10450 [Candidatus Gastranaerophilales bacterium]|nr:hypothetical protein [Candidatus Gastranaerophilales bacterium]